MGIASVKMELLALGGFKFPVVAVYLNSLTSLTVLELQNAVNSLGGQRCIGSGAMESTYPAYSGSLQPFSFTTESGYTVEFTVRYDDHFRPRPENLICLFDFYVKKENQNIVLSNHNYGYNGGNPWVEFSPALMFIAPSGKIVVPNVYGYFGYYGNSDDNLTCYLDGAYYVSPIIPNAPITGGQNYGNGFIEIDVEHSDIPIASPSGTPYGGEPSGQGGGDGGHDLIIDDIGFPSLPSISAASVGFISMWVPTGEQLARLAAYMWNMDITTSDFWRKIVANPLELIYGLNIMPVPIDREHITRDTVTVGWFDTGIEMDCIPQQYIEVDCGTIDLQEYWKAYIDYSPYTKIDIYLPYIGAKTLNTNDIMGRNVSLKYVIDLASGACLAMIKADDSVYYHFSGNCASPVPVTSQQFQEVIKNVMSTAVSAGVAIGSAIATEGASLVALGAAGAAAGSAAKTVSTPPTVTRSGSVASAAGFMGVQTPYLIITRPNLCMPEEQQKYTGFPAFIAEDLGELNGYTEVEVVHLHVMGCTDDELTEIDELLKKGVIF